MIQTTVNELLQGKVDHVEFEGIYIFRDGEHVLYVGRSVDVIQRLYDHIEKYTSSAIGDLVYNNHPSSLFWQIDLLLVEECMPVVRSFYRRYRIDEALIADIETAELAMIQHYHPCANTANNPDRKRLPAHIKRYARDIRAGATDALF